MRSPWSLPRHSRTRTLALSAIAVASVFGLTLGASQPASAAVYRYNVINKTSTTYVTGSVFASCKITTTGGYCTISRGKSVDRSIQVSLGAGREAVSAGLGISSSFSVTTSVGCTSPALKAGQTWKARAVGTRYYYRLQQQQAYKPRVGATSWRTVATSGYLAAYSPYSSAISCGL